ncbi:helix-turn-helix transcriptional regulator [Galbibacter pacificus]|uniref:Helix-turn-helix domain-containing protein n=1 Tax=Galbibacter pacificus TaxID=2996052 RepID=A0ABT6FRN3_9FLAO|nr:helix-turn-helix domain-containing protein [Galbibacter pacificus]MDG3582958.1 helix-turn-helix domain-containing protein [Galbibacter pacificus]MDG3585923.1 helix-turn-helix domain-containing protein [Galbibacter pacificus]
MEDKELTYHLLKIITELEHRIAERVIVSLPDLPASVVSTHNEKLLKDVELCDLLQISTSHFYKLKKKHKNFPTHCIGEAKRYKQSEVEHFFKQLNQQKDGEV